MEEGSPSLEDFGNRLKTLYSSETLEAISSSVGA
jgi:hypothetical protein